MKSESLDDFYVESEPIILLDDEDCAYPTKAFLHYSIPGYSFEEFMTSLKKERDMSQYE